MKFMAFNLADVMEHHVDGVPKVSVRMIDASDISKAKVVMSTYHGEWVVIPIDVISAGRVPCPDPVSCVIGSRAVFYNADCDVKH